MRRDFHRTTIARLACAGALSLLLLGACGHANVTIEDNLRVAALMKERHDVSLARTFYERALHDDSSNAEALSGLASLQDEAGDRAGAIATLQRLVDAHPDDAAAQRKLGRMLLASEKPLLAKDHFAEALRHDDKNPKLLGEMAVALDYTGDHSGAQDMYRKALMQDPGNLALTNNLAYSFILDGDPAQAIALLEPVQNDPKATPALRQNLGLAYGLAGMESDAERVAKRDLPPAQVKEALASYKRKRAEMIVSTSPMVDLGSYATQGMAEAAARDLLPRLQAQGGGMRPVIAPEIAAASGTPRFSLRLMGCSNPEGLQKFCDSLIASGMPCRPVGY